MLADLCCLTPLHLGFRLPCFVSDKIPMSSAVPVVDPWLCFMLHTMVLGRVCLLHSVAAVAMLYRDVWHLQVNMRPINDMEDELKQRRQYTRNTSNEAYDSDSEEEGGGRGGGQRVQCAQQ